VTEALVLAAVLAGAAVIVVALPFLRHPTPDSDIVAEPDDAELERLRLAEERDRALAALKELEADHRAGRIADEDYRALIGPMRREAAAALRAADAPRGRPTEGSADSSVKM
jgi:hypothetical protein